MYGALASSNTVCWFSALAQFSPGTAKKEADLYHGLTWPQLSFVAEDDKGRIVGYILAKM